MAIPTFNMPPGIESTEEFNEWAVQFVQKLGEALYEMEDSIVSSGASIALGDLTDVGLVVYTTGYVLRGNGISMSVAQLLHSFLSDDEISKHRVINDAGNTTTDLFSARNILVLLSGKAERVHDHVEADITDLLHNAVQLQSIPLNLAGILDGQIMVYDFGTNTIIPRANVEGATQLSELTDVNTSTPTNRFVLIADGIDFESRALLEADISDLSHPGIPEALIDAAGDLIYGSADDTAARLALGTGRNLFLNSAGAIPAWATLTATMDMEIYWAKDYATLQLAITAAGNAGGGNVICEHTTYSEAITMSQNSVHLWGMGAIVDGNTTGHAINVTGNFCSIRDLAVQTTSGSGNAYSGVYIDSGVVNCYLSYMGCLESDHRGFDLRGSFITAFNCSTAPDLDSFSWVVNATVAASHISCCTINANSNVNYPFYLNGDNCTMVGNFVGTGTTNNINIGGTSSYCTCVANAIVNGGIADTGLGNAVAHNV